MGFCFAPRFHPAMRHAGPVRRELGVPTVFNFLGPLANPARRRRQLVGVSDPTMASEDGRRARRPTAAERAMVVYADDGLDELSVTSPSTVLEVTGGADGTSETRTWRLDPNRSGFPPATMDDLRGGDAAFNAAVIRAVLAGERGPRRDIGVLNAAAALVVAGTGGRPARTGSRWPRPSIDEGRPPACSNALVARLDGGQAAEAHAERARAQASRVVGCSTVGPRGRRHPPGAVRPRLAAVERPGLGEGHHAAAEPAPGHPGAVDAAAC